MFPKVKDLIFKREKSNIGKSTLFSIITKIVKNVTDVNNEIILGSDVQPHVPPSDIKSKRLARKPKKEIDP
ncbi:hypothetical protein JCM16816_08770 [Thermoanaerobacter brockii subsp. lactiethylicus]